MLCLKKIAPTRLIKNALYESIYKAESQGADVDELREILGKAASKRGIFDGDLENGELEIGQIASSIKDIDSSADIIKRIIEEFEEAKEKVSTFSFTK